MIRDSPSYENEIIADENDSKFLGIHSIFGMFAGVVRVRFPRRCGKTGCARGGTAGQCVRLSERRHAHDLGRHG